MQYRPATLNKFSPQLNFYPLKRVGGSIPRGAIFLPLSKPPFFQTPTLITP